MANKLRLNPFAKRSSNDNNQNQNANNGPQNQLPDNQPAGNPNEHMLKFIKSTGAFDSVNTQDFLSAMQSGDHEKLAEQLQALVIGAVSASLQGSNKLVTQAMDKTREELTTSVQRNTRKDLGLEQLREKFPKLAGDEYGPILETVYDKFLETSNGNTAEAIKQTGDYFKQFVEDTAGNFGLNLTAPSASRRGSFNQPLATEVTNNNSGRNSGEIDENGNLDWESFLANDGIVQRNKSSQSSGSDGSGGSDDHSST